MDSTDLHPVPMYRSYLPASLRPCVPASLLTSTRLDRTTLLIGSRFASDLARPPLAPSRRSSTWATRHTRRSASAPRPRRTSSAGSCTDPSSGASSASPRRVRRRVGRMLDSALLPPQDAPPPLPRAPADARVHLYTAHLAPLFRTHEAQIDLLLARMRVWVYAFVRRQVGALWEQLNGAVGAAGAPTTRGNAQYDNSNNAPDARRQGDAGGVLGGLWRAYGPALLASGAAMLRPAASASPSMQPPIDVNAPAPSATSMFYRAPPAYSDGGAGPTTTTQSILERRRQLDAELAVLSSIRLGPRPRRPRRRSQGTRPARASWVLMRAGSVRRASALGARFEEVEVPSDGEGYDVRSRASRSRSSPRTRTRGQLEGEVLAVWFPEEYAACQSSLPGLGSKTSVWSTASTSSTLSLHTPSLPHCMAEIVGLVASILQLVDTAAKTRAYINDFRDAPKEQQKLLAEIENLKPLLEELQKRITTGHSLGWVNSMQQFKEPLIQLQRVIADLTRKLKSSGRVSKVLSRLSWPLRGKEDAEKELGTVERFKSLLITCLAMDIWESAQEQRQDHRDILKSVQDARADHVDNISSLKEIVQMQRIDHRDILESVQDAAKSQQRYQDSTERDVLIEWLSPLNFFPRHADIFSARQPGTGVWLLEDERFKDWKINSGQMLWCHGMPGAGKTVLASVAVDHLRTEFSTENIGVACIYLNHKEAETQSPVNLLASLWRQFVLKKAIPSATADLYERHREQRTRPSLGEVNAILASIAAEYSRAYVVIDALDEYPEGSRNDMLKCIRSLGHNVSLLLTSRPHINIEAAFPGSLGVEIRATEQDIRRYIQGQIIQSSRLTEHVASRPELGDEIESTILQNVDGMWVLFLYSNAGISSVPRFLLAKLHIDSLATKNTVKAVMEALRNLPKDLNRTYDEALQRIDRQNEDDRNTAQLTLCWVSNAKRLLSVSELIEALAVEPGTVALDPDARLNINTVLSVCAGLVIIDQAGTVRLIHYTTQRYLDDVQPLRFPDAQTQLTGTCITYLSFDTITNLPPIFKTSDATRKEYPFLDYAISYCLVHARGIPELQIQGSILSFLSHASRWVIYWQSDSDMRPSSASALWIAVFFDLHETVKHLLAQSNRVPKPLDEEKGSAMHIACRRGHLDLVQLLIDNGFDIHATLDSERFGTALHAAAYGGHTAVARLLIENDAHIDNSDLANWTMYGSALQTASFMGNVEMIRFLVMNGADINSGGGRYGTALGEVSRRGDEEMVCFLIQNGADVNVQPLFRYEGSALTMARNEAIARILLKHGADVNAVGGHFGAALHRASGLGMEEIVRLMIEHGANKIDARGDFDWGPTDALQVPRSNVQEGTARILRENGARLHAQARGVLVQPWESSPGNRGSIRSWQRVPIQICYYYVTVLLCAPTTVVQCQVPSARRPELHLDSISFHHDSRRLLRIRQATSPMNIRTAERRTKVPLKGQLGLILGPVSRKMKQTQQPISLARALCWHSRWHRPLRPNWKPEIILLISDSQATNYFAVAGLVVVLLEHISNFGDEVELVWKTRPSLFNVFYIWIRYFTLFAYSVDVSFMFREVKSNHVQVRCMIIWLHLTSIRQLQCLLARFWIFESGQDNSDVFRKANSQRVLLFDGSSSIHILYCAVFNHGHHYVLYDCLQVRIDNFRPWTEKYPSLLPVSSRRPGLVLGSRRHVNLGHHYVEYCTAYFGSTA
ncbi:hypothetical protein C8J57DRAFT_1477581 [Mycena rebaudengoi]|nr:hypothetical protein C8J57DRAFT_1477581 [Mycena rebaudengoi]